MTVSRTNAKASPFSTVRCTRAHEQIVDQLQQAILGGTLAPGTRLPSERAMMAEFHVSRPTIREALRVAENMGLISVRPGDREGSKVLCTPSIGIWRVLESLLQTGCMSALELVEMSIVLNSSAAALASTQPKSRLAELRKALEEIKCPADFHAYAEEDANFHKALIVASGNRLFQIVFLALNHSIRTLIENSVRSSKEWNCEGSRQRHVDVVDAIQKGEAHRAACAVRSHLRDFYLPVLSAKDKPRLTSFLQAMEGEAPQKPED
jgi:GntR family transcriptional regulator, transcriptional repressor for pyruvate dehydrogenase complex